MEHLDLFLCSGQPVIKMKVDHPELLFARCYPPSQVSFLIFSRGETKTDVLRKKKLIPFLLELCNDGSI